MQVRPSMGTVGDAYDNAIAESSFASMEGELIERSTFQSKAQARMAVAGCPIFRPHPLYGLMSDHNASAPVFDGNWGTRGIVS